MVESYDMSPQTEKNQTFTINLTLPAHGFHETQRYFTELLVHDTTTIWYKGGKQISLEPLSNKTILSITGLGLALVSCIINVYGLTFLAW